jgi:hypothetical protein
VEDPNKITYFAKTNSRGKETPFGIKRRDRARHMYVIGKTGMGKSTLLENMAIQDIRNGEGMAFIDPHGSTADRIMEYVPEHRIKDVIYFAPFDMEHPIAFNVMEDVGYDKRHLVVSGLITAFKKLWVDSFSARMEYILSNTLLALLEFPDATMLDVNRMLVEKPFRTRVIANIKDPVVKKFWTEEFANYTDRYTQEATPAIQNKVGQFTSNPLIRNIIGQPKSSFDIRQVMDEKKILIINLSKGRVGEVNASLLGSMLVTKIYLAAMSRADVPANVLAKLPNFYFYVDEFQNFANESFADILSEARKYKLNLLIAHQYVEQMEEEVRDAVFGNVGTTVAFRVGPFDAEVLETIFQPQFMATDLVNLGFAQIYLTLMIDGVGSPPFSATTLSPFDPPPQSFVPQVIASSRKQFCVSRQEVEEMLANWQAQDPIVAEPPKPKRDQYRPQQREHSAPRTNYEPRREERPPAPPRRDESQDYRENRFEEPVFETRDMVKTPPPQEIRPTPGPRGFAASTSVPNPRAEARHVEAKTVGARVEQLNSRATSQAMSEPTRQPEQRPRQPTPQSTPPPERRPEPRREREEDMPPPKPPLEGAKSLRDALMQVSKNKPAEDAASVEPQPIPHRRPPAHPAPDLKDVLAKTVQTPPLQKTQPVVPAPTPVPERMEPVSNQQESVGAGLPEDVMRAMLAVDNYGDETP